MKSLKSAFIIFLSSAILLNGCGRQKDDNSPSWDVSDDNIVISVAKLIALVGTLSIKIGKDIIETRIGLKEPTEYVTPDEEAKIQAETILKVLINKDPEPVKTIFCERAGEKFDLDSELKNFIGFIDGNIVSYEIWGNAGGGSTRTGEGWIEHELHGGIRNIKTDTRKTYEVWFQSFDIQKDHPNAIGVTYLRINDKDMFDPEKGDYPEGSYYEIDVYP